MALVYSPLLAYSLPKLSSARDLASLLSLLRKVEKNMSIIIIIINYNVFSSRGFTGTDHF